MYRVCCSHTTPSDCPSQLSAVNRMESKASSVTTLSRSVSHPMKNAFLTYHYVLRYHFILNTLIISVSSLFDLSEW